MVSAAEKCRSTRKNSCKRALFKAIAKLENAFKKRPVFTIMLMVKSGKNSCKIRDFFFLRKHSSVFSCFSCFCVAPLFMHFFSFSLSFILFGNHLIRITALYFLSSLVFTHTLY